MKFYWMINEWWAKNLSEWHLSPNLSYPLIPLWPLFFSFKKYWTDRTPLSIKNARIDDNDDDDDDDDDDGNPGNRASLRGYCRGGIRFFSPSQRASPPPGCVRVPGWQKRATPCQKSRYVNAPREPGLEPRHRSVGHRYTGWAVRLEWQSMMISSLKDQGQTWQNETWILKNLAINFANYIHKTFRTKS